MTTHTCTYCNHVSSLPINMVWEGFACVRCEHLFAKENNIIVDKGRVTHPRVDNSLKIGDSGMLDEELWTVTGFSRQKVDDDVAWWAEYYLSNNNWQQAFLSNYNGHWMWAKESQEASHSFATNRVVSLPEGEYELYSRENFTTVYAEGFFNHAFPEGKRISKEYICPPYAMLFEIDADGVHQYKARAISQKELRAAFPAIRLPSVMGINKLANPFASVLESVVIVMLSLIFLSVMMFFVQSPKRPIIEQNVRIDPFNDTSVVTKVFELKHNVQILSVDLMGQVSNSWVDIGASLINIETGEERYTDNEVAYYEGIEDGESWSEGTTEGSIKFCRVPKGKYFIEFGFYTPTESVVHYSIKEGGRSTWAYWIAMIGLVIMGAVAIAHYRNRWSDSYIQ